MADWSPLSGRAAITVFHDHLSNLDDIVERLLPFDVVCVMRERTSLPRTVIERLPRLKLIDESPGHLDGRACTPVQPSGTTGRKRPGTTSTSPTSTATPCGPTSRSRFCTRAPGS